MNNSKAKLLPAAEADWDTPDQQVVRKLVEDFPFEMPLLVDLGAARALCSPRISTILSENGKYFRSGNLRHANASVSVVGLMKWGYNSPVGRQITAAVTHIHGQHGISDEEMWYALATLVRQPIVWIERYGWRPMEAPEKEALFQFWREVGKRMRLSDPPVDFSALERLFCEYEYRHFAQAPQNKQMVEVARREWVGRFPFGLRWMANAIFLSVLEEPIRQTLGLPQPWRMTERAISAFFLFRRRLLATFPRMRQSWWAGGWALVRGNEAESLQYILGMTIPSES